MLNILAGTQGESAPTGEHLAAIIPMIALANGKRGRDAEEVAAEDDQGAKKIVLAASTG